MTNKGKYETRNPVKRFLLNRFLRRVHRVVASHPGSVLDVGVGEGLFWEGLDRPELVGIDLRNEALVEAQGRGIETRLASAFDLPFDSSSFDLVIAVEILEHLMEPERAVSEIARVARSTAIVTVPWEPWFSLLVLIGNGSHVRRLGREPEHVQAFGPRTLGDLLSTSFQDVQVMTVFPWIVAEASIPRP